MRAFWGLGTNVGDTLTPVILEHFTGKKAEWVSSLEDSKLLFCGSILEFAKPGDTVLGAGHYKEKWVNLDGVRVLALRGPNSGDAPVYGDPAILLPLIYRPKIRKTKRIGYTPHLWDQRNYTDFIDVNLPWKQFVYEVLKCDQVVSSSLHGVIIAEAYGVPATWLHCIKVPGAKLKYQDYLRGLDAERGLEHAQSSLIKALEQL